MIGIDYIIIGAGSAGCVLANRLSEDPDNSVLLLEAGGKDNGFLIHMPAGVGELISTDKVNWYYNTEQQKELNNRSLFWPRGKVLGGSSSINGMIYIRGHAQDYDLWRQMGLRGWGFDEVLPYFKKSEDNEAGKNDFHGIDGPLGVSNASNSIELFDAFIDAGLQAGHTRTNDFNGSQQEGMGNSEELNKFNIPVVNDLPGVGQNLQDHLDCIIMTKCVQPITLASQTNPIRAMLTAMQYILFKSGPGTTQGLEAGAFLKTKLELEAPDIQVHFIAEKDIEVLRDGVKLVRNILGQDAMMAYRGEEIAPGASIESDEDIDAWIRASAETIYHPIGTAKMGTDDMAVVDERCRVHGMEGLRVVDASVMPTLVGGNTNAPTIMIAEKISDDILGRPTLAPL